MRYQHLKTARKITKYIGLVLPLVIILFLIARNPHVPNFLVSSGHTVAQPFWSFQGFVDTRFSNVSSYFKNKNELHNENEQLKQAIAELQRKVFLTDSLSAENKRLLGLLGRSSEDSGLLTASVLQNKNNTAHDMFLLGIGAEDGVRDFMLVLSPEQIAIGYIFHTLDNTAVVKRFSSPDVSFTSVINASTSVQTSFVGQGSGSVTITLPRDVEVSEGDAVMLPSLSVYPIGTVSLIEVSPEDAFKILYVRSPVNTHTIRHVFIDTTTTWNAETLNDFEIEVLQEDEDE